MAYHPDAMRQPHARRSSLVGSLGPAPLAMKTGEVGSVSESAVHCAWLRDRNNKTAPSNAAEGVVQGRVPSGKLTSTTPSLAPHPSRVRAHAIDPTLKQARVLGPRSFAPLCEGCTVFLAKTH